MEQKLAARILGIALVIGLVATGCTGREAASPPEEVSAMPVAFGNVVTASGKVVPARWATLSFETSGLVTWLVAEGSQVAAGDVLARLDATDLEHAVAQARAALATAQAQLAAAKAGATPEEIAAAEGAVLAAQGGVAAAKAAVTQAEISAEIADANVKQAEDTVDAAEAALAQAQGTLDAAEAALTQARGTLEAAKAELARAQAELARLQAGARPEEIAAAEAALRQAQAALEGAKQAYDVIAWQPGAESTQVGIAYRQALAAVEQAQAQVNLLKAGATEEEIAAAKAGVNAAQAQVSIAQAGVDAAQAQVTVAEAGVDAAEAALAQAQDAVVAAQGQARLAEVGVVAAQAQVEVAEGQLARAEAQRDRLKAGATAEEIAVLEAQVAQAEAALAQAKSALAKATLVAPFDGTVGMVYLREGEIIAPGTPALVLGDVGTLRVETTDLDEIDVARVKVGQEVAVTFDALPERLFTGQVTWVSPMAEPGAGGVHYTVVIELDEIDPAIRWGMTAFVDITVDS